MTILKAITAAVNYSYITLLISLVIVKAAQMVIEQYRAKEDRQKNRIMDFQSYMGDENMIPITVVVPICDGDEDAAVVLNTIDQLLELEYGHMEIIVVNDGCGDTVNNSIIDHYELSEIEHAIKRSIPIQKIRHVHYNSKNKTLTYVEKAKGGIFDAINCGINISQCPMFTCISPGAVFEKDALLKLSFEFFKDSSTIVSCGILRIENNATHSSKEAKQGVIGYKQGIKIVECISMTAADMLNREASCELYSHTGTFALFQKQAVMDCKGYSPDSDGSHYEMMLKLQETLLSSGRSCRITSQRNVLCSVPLNSAGKTVFDRYGKWQRTVSLATFKHLKPLADVKKYKTLSLKVAYNLIFNIVFVLFEALSYITLPVAALSGHISLRNYLLFTGIYFSAIMLNNVTSILVDQQLNECYITPKASKKIILYSILEVLGYHQIVIIKRAFVIVFGLFSKKEKAGKKLNTSVNKLPQKRI